MSSLTTGAAGRDKGILSVAFNQDSGCFAVGTDRGFRIYNCDPFKLTFQREFRNGGLGIVQMLFRSNLLALVGGGKSPRYPQNKVILWDDHQNRPIGELTFKTDVRAVRLRRDSIVVVLDGMLYVYGLQDLQLRFQYEIWNPGSSRGKGDVGSGAAQGNHAGSSQSVGAAAQGGPAGSAPAGSSSSMGDGAGIVAVSGSPNAFVLAFAAKEKGKVQWTSRGDPNPPHVKAHESEIAAISLNFDGTRLATASEKGTLIRVFDTATRQQIKEVRRGMDCAAICSVSFSMQSEWLAVTSDKGTLHIFALEANTQNRKSALSALSTMLPSYFSSEWSIAQFRLPDMKSICAFSDNTPNSLIVLSEGGSFYKVTFDPKEGGECQVLNSTDFSTRPTEEVL